MKQTRWLLIVLFLLASAGCAGRDWVSDLLVLTDVTGTWEGSAAAKEYARTLVITMVLQQSGPKVTGELLWSGGGSGARAGPGNWRVLSMARC